MGRGESDRVAAGSHAKASDRISERALPILIIIDNDFRVVMASQGFRGEKVGFAFVDVEAGRLSPAVDEVVHDLVASWNDPNPDQLANNDFGVVPPCYIVRVMRLDGALRRFIAVMIEQVRHRESLMRAAQMHSLSPRETEVLWLIIKGASAPEIANTLGLAGSTVQGYFKHLLSKTNSRNGPSMVAKVLGWDGLLAASTSQYGRELVGARWKWWDMNGEGIHAALIALPS